MTIRETLAGIALLSLCTAPLRAEDQAYGIRLSRPMYAGQTFSLDGQSMFVQTTSGEILGGAADEQTTKYIMRMRSDVMVTEVDEQGRATRATHTIREGLLTENGRPIRELKPGSRLTARRDEGLSAFALDGKPIRDERMIAVLRLIASLEDDGPTTDELFGTEEPRRVGESWPLNRAVALKSFREQTAQPLSEEQLDGHSTLLEVFEYQGQPCLKVLTEVATDGAIVGLEALPEGATREEAGMAIKFEGLFPQDQQRPWLALSSQVDIHLVMHQAGIGTLRSDTRLLANIQVTPTSAPTSPASPGSPGAPTVAGVADR